MAPDGLLRQLLRLKIKSKKSDDGYVKQCRKLPPVSCTTHPLETLGYISIVSAAWIIQNLGVNVPLVKVLD